MRRSINVLRSFQRSFISSSINSTHVLNNRLNALRETMASSPDKIDAL